MKFYLIGIIAGMFISLFTILPDPGIQFNALWTMPVDSPGEAQGQIKGTDGPVIPVRHSRGFYLLDSGGSLLSERLIENALFSISGNGSYYASYQQTGRGIEFFTSAGERLWRLESADYPYLSTNGQVIFLLNGDQTGITILDIDSREAPGGFLHGRLCTVISFSENSDNGIAGFFSGHYYVTDEKGALSYKGITPDSKPVKSAAVSDNGLFASIHYGSPDGDYLLLIDIENNRERTVSLEEIYIMRNPIHVSDRGRTLFIEKNRAAAWSARGSLLFQIGIPEKREGYASVSHDGDYYAAAYTGTDGGARLIFFSGDGLPLFAESFPLEGYGDLLLKEGLIFLRGSHNLYSYSFR